MRKKTPSQTKIDEVSREIQWYLSYATLSMYYSMMKVLNTTPQSQEREDAIEIVDKLVSTAQTLYDDLIPEQKELMKELALRMIEIVEN